MRMNGSAWRCAAVVVVAACVGIGARGQVGMPRLVKDVADSQRYCRIESMVTVGERVLMDAQPSESARGLWVTDGTREGTVRLAAWLAQQPVRVGNVAVFAVSAAAGQPAQAWVSDGTIEGTRALGGASAELTVLGPFREAGSIAYFGASRPGHPYELWATDGTDAGTRRVGAIQAGISGRTVQVLAVAGDAVYVLLSPSVGDLYRVDVVTGAATLLRTGGVRGLDAAAVCERTGRVVFAASDAAGGTEPWTSDGTAAGTRPLMDVAPGAAGSTPSGFAEFGGEVYFGAIPDAETGLVLYKTDGTEAGTTRVQTLGGGGEVIQSVKFAGQLVFVAGYAFSGRLWATDGTSEGTRVVSTVQPSGHWDIAVVPLRPRRLLVDGGRLYVSGSEEYIGDPDVLENTASQVWRLDESFAAERITELAPAPPGHNGPGAFAVMSAGRERATVVMSAADPVTLRELFVCDGEPSSTRLLADLGRGTGDSTARPLVAVGGRVALTGQIRFSDGTPGALGPVLDNGASAPQGSTGFMDLAGHLVFTSGEMRTSDGSAGGTRPLMHPTIGSLLSGRDVLSVNGVGYFTAGTGSTERGVFRTDGQNVSDPLWRGVMFGYAVAGETVVVMGRRTGTTDWGLWRKGPGDAEPVSVLASTTLIPNANFERRMIGAESLVFFDRLSQLWVTDGTAAGTVAVTNTMLRPVLLTRFPAAGLPNRVLCAAEVSRLTRDLWVSDGTPGGTRRLAGTFASIEVDANGEAFVVAGERAYFAAAEVAGQTHLWVTDGTVEGTRRVMDLRAGSDEVRVLGVVPGNSGRVYVAARAEGTGRELYTSDGTAEGTRLVADLFPGPGDGVRVGTYAATANNRFFFYGDNGDSGVELFVVNACIGDFDNDGAVGVQDLLGYVGAYLAGAASAEVDGLAGIRVEDLLLFVEGWFGGCGG